MSWFYFASRFQFPVTRERSLHPLGWKCYFTNHPSRCSHYRGLWKSVFLSRWLFQGLTFISGRWLVPYRKGLFEGGLFNIRTSWGIEILEVLSDIHIPWRSEKHRVLSVSTYDSLSRWAGVIHCSPNDIELGDFWDFDRGLKQTSILRKCGRLPKVLQSMPHEVRDCRVDVQLNDQAVIHTWQGRGGRSRISILWRSLISCLMSRPGVDRFFSFLSKSDSMLSKSKLQEVFGGR